MAQDTDNVQVGQEPPEVEEFDKLDAEDQELANQLDTRITEATAEMGLEADPEQSTPATPEPTPAEVTPPAEVQTPDPSVNPFLARKDDPAAQEVDDSDIPALKEGEIPRAEQFGQLRDITKSYKAEVKELKQRIEAQEQTQQQAALVPAAPLTPVAPAQVEPKIAPDQVFLTFAKAKSGQLSDPNVDDQQVLAASTSVFATYDAQTLSEVLNKAQAGQFGEFSDEIRNTASVELSRVNARDLESREQRHVQEREQGEWTRQNKESLGRLATNYPQLQDPNSDHVKLLPEFQRRFLGVADQNGQITSPGPLAAVMQRPDGPEVLGHFLDLFVKATNSNSMDAVVSERDELKQRLAAYSQPEAGSPHVGDEQATEFGDDSELAQMAKQLAGLTPAQTGF